MPSRPSRRLFSCSYLSMQDGEFNWLGWTVLIVSAVPLAWALAWAARLIIMVFWPDLLFYD